MLDAQLLFDGSTVYSPWFPRQADNVTCMLEVVEIAGTGATLKVELWTKNSEDTGDGDNADNGGSPKKIERTATGRGNTT